MFFQKYFLYFLLFLFGSVLIFGIMTYNSVKKACSRYEKPHIAKIKKENYKNLVIKHNNKSSSTEEVEFISEDGIKVSGLLVNRVKSNKILLVCHGYRQVKELMYPLADMFDELTILFFDFRSHGESKGNLVSLGYHEYKDIKSAVKFLSNDPKTKNKSIYGLGFSMGAAALIKAASEITDFKALILDSPFAQLDVHLCREFSKVTGLPKCMTKVGKCVFEILTSSKVKDINPVNFIKLVKAPILIVHSDTDQVVPVLDAYKLFELVKTKKELWITSGQLHARIFKEVPCAYKNKILSFINAC